MRQKELHRLAIKAIASTIEVELDEPYRSTMSYTFRKIPPIKKIRDASGMGLREAKNYVEELFATCQPEIIKAYYAKK